MTRGGPAAADGPPDDLVRDRGLADAGGIITDLVAGLKTCASYAYGFRGWCFYQKKDLDRVIADCSEAIRLNLKARRDDSLRGWAWERKGQYDRALADHDEARLKLYRARTPYHDAKTR